MVKERLLVVVNVKNLIGTLIELLKTCFNQHGLYFNEVVGESFDGESNMNNSFSGLHY